jgi:hypothetical protein
MALPLDGDQLAVADGRNRSPTRQPSPQWLAAFATAFFLPGEGQPRQGQISKLVERGRLLSFLTQNLVDG